MSTSAISQLIDDRMAMIDSKVAIIRFGIPFNEVIGLPRETRVIDLKRSLATTMKGGRISVRVRHDSQPTP